MNKALKILNSNEIESLIRISVFHYLFGYIHPFYDGNGRTSRFISSYLLSKEFESIIGYRISYTIKENIKDYYNAFKICNDPHNFGDLTPFIITFTNIINISMHQLVNALESRRQKLSYYQNLIYLLPKGSDEKYFELYSVLIQASLFSEDGISTQELIEFLRASRTTVSKRLKELEADNLLSKKSNGNIKLYELNLNTVDELAENKKK